MNTLAKRLLQISLLGIFIISFSFLLSFANISKADNIEINNENIEIIFFGSPTCPHCIEQKKFLKNLKEEYPEIIINEYDLATNINLATTQYEEYNIPKNQQGLIPITFIADSDIFFVGFNDQIAKDIEALILGFDIEKSSVIKIPFFGEFNVYDFSLPALAITLGIVDGFNVCSLGALVVILGLVMIFKSRKRIILLGGTFILITGFAYGLLMLLWYKLFSFIAPYITSMEIFIAIISLIAGAYLFKEFVKAYKQGPTCSSDGILSKLTPKVEKMFASKKNIAVLIGVVSLFAIIVTIIEFPCSAALPMIFTSVLVEAGIGTAAALGYIGLFLLFYMLDEIIIFLIAVFTMRLKIVSPKFIIFFNLLASCIFLFLGFYYLSRIF